MIIQISQFIAKAKDKSNCSTNIFSYLASAAENLKLLGWLQLEGWTATKGGRLFVQEAELEARFEWESARRLAAVEVWAVGVLDLLWKEHQSLTLLFTDSMHSSIHRLHAI